MTINTNDLQVLREKLLSEKRKIDEQEKALNIVESMMKESSVKIVNNQAQQPARTNRVGLTLKEKVLDVANSYKDKEFTVSEINNELTRRGEPVTGQMPKSRISSTLLKLVNEGKLERTSEGIGNKPHKYKIN